MGDRTTDESTTDESTSESDDDPAVLRATFGGRIIDVNPVGGTSSNAAWSTMQNTFADVAARYMGTTVPRVPTPRRVSTGRTAARRAAMVREARLRIFDGAVPARGSAAGLPIASTSASTANLPPRSAVPAASTSNARIPTVASLPRAIPHQAPVGTHRTVNLICPHCRDAVHNAPFRVFVLTELVEIVRQAESDGLLSSGSGSTSTDGRPPSGLGAEEKLKEKKEAEDKLPGLAEGDTTWGGLFRRIGVPETSKEKRERLAQVMVDADDAVVRCPSCNWEVSRDTGECEGW